MSLSLFDVISRLNRLHILHRICIFRQAAKHGLHFGQPPILEFVASHRQCTQREVADFLHVSPPSIATSVKRMQKAGLLVKSPDDRDQRCNCLAATEKGQRVARLCRQGFDQIDRQMLAGFSEQELEQLCGFYDRMTANLASGEFAGRSFFSLVAEFKKLKETTGEEK